MTKEIKDSIVPDEAVMSKIYYFRDKKVMLDRDLAELYGVETRVLNQAVRRNIKRFPEDFMFQMTKDEVDEWKSQIVITNADKMGLRKAPIVFSEQGVAMLSSRIAYLLLGSEQYSLANKLRGPIPDLKIHSQATLHLSGKENDHLLFDTCNRQWPMG